eukprot:Tbor_TRINITY_DN5325_c3_g7::TRINITY_DN5325_c3_g7_i1::g.5029::m.5029
MTKGDVDSVDWRAQARAHRVHESIKKRLFSVIFIYAVISALVVLVLIAFKWHPSHCQRRVKEAELVIFAHGSVSEDIIKGGIDKGLGNLGLFLQTASRKDPPLSNWVESFYDTPDFILRGSSIQVRKRTWAGSPYIEYALRYLSNDICTDNPPFDLTSEKISGDYSKNMVYAVSDGFQTSFVFQKFLYSKVSSRVDTVGDMAAVFPSLRQIFASSSAESMKFNEYKVHPIYSDPIYSNSSQSLLISDISLERWVAIDDRKEGFWLVRLHIGSLYEESLMAKVHKSIKHELNSNKQLCPNFCGFPLIYF